MFLPGESQGWWSLVGCRLWGRTELDTAEAVKKVIEETKELVYVDYSYHYYRVKNKN